MAAMMKISLMLLLLTVTLLSAANAKGNCDTGCSDCTKQGAGKCDKDQCDKGFVFIGDTYKCKACGVGCNDCTNHGPGKCDAGNCGKGYSYFAGDKTCKPTPPVGLLPTKGMKGEAGTDD